MKTTKRSWLIRIAFILVLVLVAVLMLRIGRGHTVYSTTAQWTRAASLWRHPIRSLCM